MNKIGIYPTIAQNLPIVPAPTEEKKVEVVEEKAPLKQRINEVGQEAIKKGCCSKCCDLIKRICEWIKSIPGKIADCFNRCLYTEDDDLDEEDFLTAVYPKNHDIQDYPKQNDKDVADIIKLLEEKKDPEALHNVFEHLKTRAGLIDSDISKMQQFEKIRDLEKLNEVTFEINAQLLQFVQLKAVLAGSALDQETIIKPVQNELEKVNEEFLAKKKVLLEKVELNKEIIEKLQEASRIIKAHESKKRLSLVIPEAFSEDSRIQKVDLAKKVPVGYKNSDNDCWFHAVLDGILWPMGDNFHQLVRKKDLDREQLQKDYEKNLAEYDKEKEQNKKKIIEFDKQITDYDKRKKQYDQEFEEYRDKVAKFHEATNKYLEEKKIFEIDKNQKEPTEPVKPIAPKPLDPRPKRPLGLSKPANPILLLDTLKLLSKAMQFGTHEDIRREAAEFKRAFIGSQAFINHGSQEDAPEFLDILLDFLSEKESLIDLRTERKGIPGTEHQGLSWDSDIHAKENDRIFHVLKLPFPEGKDHFQDILNDYFTLKDVKDKYTKPLYGEDKDAEPKQTHHYSEKTSLKNPENPANFLLIQMIRHDHPTKEQMEKERDAVDEKNKKRIQERAAKLHETNDYKTHPLQVAELAAQAQLSKERGGLLQYNENDRAKKIETLLKFPEDFRINLAESYGIKDPQNTNYIYEVKGVVIHTGAHYVANARGIHPKNGQPQWYHADDAARHKVIYLSQSQALESGGGAYSLYLERVTKP